MDKKAIFGLLTIVLSLVAVGSGVFLVKRQQELRSRAAPATVIYFAPAMATAKVEQSANFDMFVDTGTNYLATVSLEIIYDPTILKAVSLTFSSSLLPVSLKAVDLSQPGRITGSAGVSPGLPIHGASQKVASVSFRAIAAAPSGSTVDFGSGTAAYSGAPEEPEWNNLVTRSNPATIVVEGAGASPSPTPSPSPSPTSSPSPTPSPSPTTTPSPSPSPTGDGLGGGDDYGGDYGLGGGGEPSPSPSPSPAEIPVAGILTPTIFLLGVGGVFIFLGLIFLL